MVIFENIMKKQAADPPAAVLLRWGICCWNSRIRRAAAATGAAADASPTLHDGGLRRRPRRADRRCFP